MVHAVVLFMAVINVGSFFFHGKFLFQAGSPYLNQAVFFMSLLNIIIESTCIQQSSQTTVYTIVLCIRAVTLLQKKT